MEVQDCLSEFEDLFADVPHPSPVVYHDVVLAENAAPVRQGFYRVSPDKRKIIQDEVKFLLDNHLAEPSDSEWASPCILHPKSDGTFRMCTDYRRVNEMTRVDNFPLPRMDDIIDAVGKANYVLR